MNFQRSACIETLYTELPFLERFSAAKGDGFEFVEFWSWTDKDLAAVKAAADAAGVGISGFNGDAELSLIDPAQKTAYRAFLRRSLDAAIEDRGTVRHRPLKRSGGGRKGPLPL